MRILAIVYCLPPLLVPAAMCYLKLLLGLREKGVDVEAVAIRPETFVAPLDGLEDPTLLRLLPQDMRVHWVRSPESHPVVKLLKRSDAVYRSLYRVFEPRKREWTFAARRVISGIDLSRFDVVLTCSQPHANHLLGFQIQRRTGLPWVAYFSDPWTGNPYARETSPQIVKHHRQLEERVLTAADLVLFTSPEMERQALRKFEGILRNKTGVLPHGYVPDWYGLVETTPPPPGPLRILHTGHFYGPRSPAPLLKALSRLADRHDLKRRALFSFYGSFPPQERAWVREAGLEHCIRIHEPIPYLESLSLMMGSDALLLVDAPLRDARESVFLPSKLVDYLGSGKPLLAVTPSDGASARVVKEVGGSVCDVDEQAVESLLENAFTKGLPSAPDPQRASAYQYTKVASQLIDHIERLNVPASHRGKRA